MRPSPNTTVVLIACVVMAPFLIFELRRALRRGVIHWRVFETSRRESPVWFWTIFGLYVFLLVGMVMTVVAHVAMFLITGRWLPI